MAPEANNGRASLAATLLIAAACVPLGSCRAWVDADVTYHECDLTNYADEFPIGTTMEMLLERCWQLDNVQNDPSDVFPDDGDLVMRASPPTNGRFEQWFGPDQAPIFYQHIGGDFLVMTRVEAIDQVSGDHCLEAEGEQDNMAGLVLRREGTAVEWATFLVGPFFPMMGIDCGDMSMAPPPTRAVVASRDDAWGAPFVEEGPMRMGIGEDGEADLAICRVNDSVTYYFRDPNSSPMMPMWSDAIAAHRVPAGPLDVGLTAPGRDPVYVTEGHFNWVVFTSIGADGCGGALEKVVLPMGD